MGLFMIAGLAVAVTAVIWLGMSDYFEKGRMYVSYFDESVQGLDKDSPVKYRGVAIGRVKSVGLAPDATLIEVVMAIEKDVKLEADMFAQLKSVGITGIMFIEIDRKKEGDPDFRRTLSFRSDYPVIATKPSGVKMFMDGMDEVLKLIAELDTKGISGKIKAGADRISQIIADAQIREIASDIRSALAKTDRILNPEKWDRIISSAENTAVSLNRLAENADRTVSDARKNMNTLSANADRTLSDIRKSITTLSADTDKTVITVQNTVGDIDRIVSAKENDLNEVIADLKRSVKNTNAFLEEGTRMMKSSDARISALERSLLVTLENLEKTSESLNRFADILADQPSQLFFGKPPRE